MLEVQVHSCFAHHYHNWYNSFLCSRMLNTNYYNFDTWPNQNAKMFLSRKIMYTIRWKSNYVYCYTPVNICRKLVHEHIHPNNYYSYPQDSIGSQSDTIHKYWSHHHYSMFLDTHLHISLFPRTGSKGPHMFTRTSRKNQCLTFWQEIGDKIQCILRHTCRDLVRKQYNWVQPRKKGSFKGTTHKYYLLNFQNTRIDNYLYKIELAHQRSKDRCNLNYQKFTSNTTMILVIHEIEEWSRWANIYAISTILIPIQPIRTFVYAFSCWCVRER